MVQVLEWIQMAPGGQARVAGSLKFELLLRGGAAEVRQDSTNRPWREAMES